MTTYEVQLNHDWERTRSWSAQFLLDGEPYRFSVIVGEGRRTYKTWETRGLRRRTVMRRAEKRVRKMRRAEEYSEDSARRTTESRERSERYLVE